MCPDLQHIRILYPDEFYSALSITYDALFTFLESRVQTRILQSCDVLFFKHPQVKCTQIEARRFRVLVDSGLELRIRFGQSTINDTTSIRNDAPQEGLLTSPRLQLNPGWISWYRLCHHITSIILLFYRTSHFLYVI